MIQELEIQDLEDQIAQAKDLKDLEDLKVSILGKKGLLSGAMAGLAKLSIEEKRKVGGILNQYKERLVSALEQRRIILEEQEWARRLADKAIDVTLPGPYYPIGCVHPLSAVLSKAVQIFGAMGFRVEKGPDVETTFHNFDALNVSVSHPARAPGDTFYMGASDHESYLLRTHTSSVQIRALQQKAPPLRMISFGAAYRRDEVDATHTPIFHQLEGMLVEEGASMAHLKGCITEFLSCLLERSDIELRIRPSFFPFTSPSGEVDIRWKGKWLEVLGCGMVHPKVFEHCGHSPDLKGYAFGMGLERLAMLVYQMGDIREFYINDQNFLRHCHGKHLG